MLYKYLFLLKSTTWGDISLLFQSTSAGVLEQSVSIVSRPAEVESLLAPKLNFDKSYQSRYEEP